MLYKLRISSVRTQLFPTNGEWQPVLEALREQLEGQPWNPCGKGPLITILAVLRVLPESVRPGKVDPRTGAVSCSAACEVPESSSSSMRSTSP